MNRRTLAALTALAVTLAACGGGTDDATAPPIDETPASAPASTAPPPARPVALLPSQVDLRSDSVLPEAEIESNLLPSVVLDDLSAGRKVNFRNLVPQDLPVLLWMWAPS